MTNGEQYNSLAFSLGYPFNLILQFGHLNLKRNLK